MEAEDLVKSNQVKSTQERFEALEKRFEALQKNIQLLEQQLAAVQFALASNGVDINQLTLDVGMSAGEDDGSYDSDDSDEDLKEAHFRQAMPDLYEDDDDEDDY